MNIVLNMFYITVHFIDLYVFDAMILLRKICSIEKLNLPGKLNLTWNKQMKVNKVGSLSRVFQIASRGRGMDLPGERFCIG